jgi:hypothetical protein
MRKILLLFAASLTQEIAIAQYYQFQCSYHPGGYSNQLYDPTSKAEEIVNEICDAVGIDYITVFRGNLNNAAATEIDGESVIIYGSQFLNNMIAISRWAPISVLAHEVGHHVNEDASWYGQFKHPWSKELKADFISGYALAKMGASRGEATAAQQAMFDYFGSSTHPDSYKRVAAIQAGWEKGRGVSSGNGNGQSTWVACTHPLHINGDRSPCYEPMHNADPVVCREICFDVFGNRFICHPAGDLVPCSHALHPMGHIDPCIHQAHPSGHYVRN